MTPPYDLAVTALGLTFMFSMCIIQVFFYYFLTTFLFHLPPLCAAKAEPKPLTTTINKHESSEGIPIRDVSSSSFSLPPPDSIQLKPRVICFNIMVAGLSGLGKTTLCEALLESWSEIAPDTTTKTTKHFPSTLIVQASNPLEWHDAAANTILRVRIIDTPGFGNKINHRNSVQTIMEYIRKCRKDKFQNEQTQKPGDYVEADDSLVHVCLYFLSPGRFLEIDRHFLKHISNEIPILPIIAKADTLTDEEISHYRIMLKDIFEKETLRVYDSFDDISMYKKNKTSNNNSNKYHRGRRKGESLAIIARDGIYPWGQAKSLNSDHSDLKLIRDLLLSEHTEHFLSQSQTQYLNYRARRIANDKLLGGIKYAAFVGLLVSKLSSILQQSEVEFLQCFESSTRGLVSRLVESWSKRQKKNLSQTLLLETECLKQEENSIDMEASASSEEQSSFLRRVLGQTDLFCTPPYNSCFSPRSE